MQAAPRPCRHPGCGALVHDGSGYCAKHPQAARQEVDRRRGSASSRGYSSKWVRARNQFISEHPLCQCPECDEGRKRVRAASVVDHKIPHRGDLSLMWNRRNWQAMAKDCHDAKTAREDGGFGNARPRGG